ncbi:threonine dehydrogenase-like Zn-dependent dehydrogenase [Sphingomonas zeicaulis]
MDAGTMRMVRVHGPGAVSLDDVAIPRCGPTDVLVRVARCGLCGSDLGYIETGGVAAPATEPFGIGHELAGTIEAVGSAVQGIATGTRVIVNPMGDGNGIGAGVPEGAFAPLLRVANATTGGSIHPIPDHVGWDAAALAEPLAVALHAVRRGGATRGDKVAVYGAGPIGLGIIFFLKRMGVGHVAAVDLSAGRLERAARLGADLCVDASRDDIAGALGDAHGRADLFGWPTVGTNLFYEAAGGPAVLPGIVGLAPFHARVVMVAVHHAPLAIDWKMALGKEMSFITSMAYPDEFPEVIAALSEPGFDADAFISHRVPLSRFGDALAAARDRAGSAKIMVTCDA